MADRKLLCVADDSPECRSAVLYAAWRAARTGAGLILLSVVEPLDPGLWASMGEAMRARLRDGAGDRLEALAAICRDATGLDPEMEVREGGTEAEIRRFIDATPEIKALVLAAAPGRGGPGPLVNAALRGGLGHGAGGGQTGAGRAVAVMIVPGGLDDQSLSELAG